MQSSGSEEATTTTQGRTIKLYNPSSSPNTVIPFIVYSEHDRIDLATIARIFGILPATLKLNGYFIARGLDFVSSSVTWKALLSFFSSRRLTTGEDRGDAVVVDGKLCKAGTKRSYEPQAHGTENHSSSVTGVNRMPLHEVMNSIKKKRLSKSDTGCHRSDLHVSERNSASLKRKYFSEGIYNQLKKLKESASLKRKYMSEDINNQLKKLKVTETDLAISPKIQELNFYSPKIQELNFHAVT